MGWRRLMSEHGTNRTFPRDIVISPQYGAGIATWNDRGYDIVECPAFVEYVRNGGRDPDQAKSILTEAGFDTSDIYLGGLRDARVVTVHGPYRIDEYDGFESLKSGAHE